MTNTEFVKKVSQSNKAIPYIELLKVSLSFQIFKTRKLSNLELILTDKKIKEFKDAEGLIFYIEKQSRALDVKQAKIHRARREQKLNDLVDSYNKKFIEELKLNEVASKALGFSTSSIHNCTACGHIPTSSGNCKC